MERIRTRVWTPVLCLSYVPPGPYLTVKDFKILFPEEPRCRLNYYTRYSGTPSLQDPDPSGVRGHIRVGERVSNGNLRRHFITIINPLVSLIYMLWVMSHRICIIIISNNDNDNKVEPRRVNSRLQIVCGILLSTTLLCSRRDLSNRGSSVVCGHPRSPRVDPTSPTLSNELHVRGQRSDPKS